MSEISIKQFESKIKKIEKENLKKYGESLTFTSLYNTFQKCILEIRENTLIIDDEIFNRIKKETTMCEIKVNDYIRTDRGIIKKINSITDVRIIDFANACYYGDIVKHSSNIKELLEKGDYVNGYELLEFDDEEGNLYLGIPIYEDALMNCISEVRPLDTIEIKSIVTKEQFKNIEYKVGE